MQFGNLILTFIYFSSFYVQLARLLKLAASIWRLKQFKSRKIVKIFIKNLHFPNFNSISSLIGILWPYYDLLPCKCCTFSKKGIKLSISNETYLIKRQNHTNASEYYLCRWCAFFFFIKTESKLVKTRQDFIIFMSWSYYFVVLAIFLRQWSSPSVRTFFSYFRIFLFRYQIFKSYFFLSLIFPISLSDFYLIAL